MNKGPLDLKEQLQKELDELHEKYRIPYVVTEQEATYFRNLGTTFNFKAGDTTTRAPENPDTPQEAYQLFKDYYATVYFIVLKQIHLGNYETWDLDNVENEIGDIESFIKSAENTGISAETTNQMNLDYYRSSEMVEYLRFKYDYYQNRQMTGIQLLHSSTAAQVYGRYFLFYDFLRKERQSLLELKRKNAFSRKNPLEQLDLVLKWFNESPDAFPHCRIEEINRSIVKKLNYDTNISNLYDILKKLERDGYLESWESDMTFFAGSSKQGVTRKVRNYKKTWEGGYFISEEIGGYQQEFKMQNEKDNRQAIEELRNQNDYQRNVYLFWITICIAISTAMQGIWNVLETIRNYYNGGILIWANAIIPFSAAVFLIYILAIVRKELLRNWKLKNR